MHILYIIYILYIELTREGMARAGAVARTRGEQQDLEERLSLKGDSSTKTRDRKY